MRLNEELRGIIEKREKEGYVWLRRLSDLALYRLRWRTRHGNWEGTLNERGLRFVTAELAKDLEEGVRYYSVKPYEHKRGPIKR